MNKVVSFFKNVFNTIENFLYKIVLIFSRGFFFYFYLIAYLLSKLFPVTFFDNLKLFFKRRQEDTTAFLLVVLVFLFGVNIYIRFYDNNETIHVNVGDGLIQSNNSLDNTELNLYRKYAKLNMNLSTFKNIIKDNKSIVSWLMVDGTNINYPIVQTDNNQYYLNHDLNNDLKASGWTYMDYRNDTNLLDDNTIFYGHNLANKTSFGSLSNLFSNKWFDESNHYIVVFNEKGKYVYEIFSVYEIDPETYYLQNNFSNKNDYLEFLNTLKSRSIYNFNINVSKNDRIITLSTCSDDNKNRKVVHAKLIEK